ncbi:MAG: tetratricopeptide repeat protein [Polyangiaceae bacterium]
MKSEPDDLSRALQRAALAFDAEDVSFPGDDALVARISDRLMTASLAAPTSRPRWQKLALGGSGIAALALLLSLALRSRSATELVVAPSKPLPASPASVPSAAPLAAAVSVEPPSAPAVAEPIPRVAAPRAPEVSAEELFAQANRARREGEPARAAALYRRLTAEFSRTKEALAAEVPLALLELKAGRNSAALRHFDAYSRRAPQGELGSEALWGRAQAEFGLGQGDAARQSLELLLKRYPNSAYASAARAKLEAKPD